MHLQVSMHAGGREVQATKRIHEPCLVVYGKGWAQSARAEAYMCLSKQDLQKL